MSDTDFDTLLDDKARAAHAAGLSAMTRKACARPCACS